MIRRIVFSLACCSACLLTPLIVTQGAVAQTAAVPAPQAQAPVTTLRVTHREIVLDVVVTDRNKQPVTNLTRDQFHIYEDKAEQRLLGFSPPNDHVPPPDTPPVTSAVDLRKLGNVPLNIIVLDELNTAFEDLVYGRSQLQHYLQSQPAVLDQPTTLLSVSDSNLRMLHDFTQHRDELVATTKAHVAAYPFSMAKGGDEGTRLARCFGALLQIAQSSKGYLGRKNIIWIGKGFPSLDTSQETAGHAAKDLAALRLVTTALLESRISLNVIDPTPLSPAQADLSNPEMLTPAMLLQATGANGVALADQVGDPTLISFFQFAPATGGLAFYARNDINRQIATAVEAGAQYYTLTYSPNKQGDDTSFRNIAVKLGDPNLVVWTRTGYFPEKTIKPSEQPAPPATSTLAFDLTSAALAMIPYSGLDVSAEKVKDAPLYKVAVTPIGMTFRSSKNGQPLAEVTTMTVVFGNKQRVLSHDIKEVSAVVGSTSEPFTFTLPAKDLAQASRVRIVVRDALSGQLGTVDFSPNPDVPYDPAQIETTRQQQQKTKGNR